MTTIIIFDWDDTLFPTTHLNKNKFIDQKTLRTIDLAVYSLLSRALLNGKVFLITNASLEWVNDSTQKLPLIRSLLRSSVGLISARDNYSWYANDINVWKQLAFDDLIKAQWNVRKVVSIGDDKYEYLALRRLGSNSNRLTLKSVKTTFRPTIWKLIDQIRAIDARIDGICSSHKHMDLYI